MFTTSVAIFAEYLIYCILFNMEVNKVSQGAQWLSGRVLDSRPRGRGFEPHRRHCVVVHEQDTYILVQHRNTRPCLTERLLMGRKKSNQTNKKVSHIYLYRSHCTNAFFYIVKCSKYTTVEFFQDISLIIYHTFSCSKTEEKQNKQ